MNTKTYKARRESLRKTAPEGVLLLMGNGEASRNYADNVYPFRQDSHFLYYLGTDLPDMAAVIGPDGDTTLFGAPADPDNLVWLGPHPVLADHAAAAGVEKHESFQKLPEVLAAWREKGAPIHYLPPYRGERRLLLANLLGVEINAVHDGVSTALSKAIATQRSIKTAAEVAEIEEALAISKEMYEAAFALSRAGKKEHEIAAAIQAVHLRRDRQPSFPPIVSIRGEVLHNTSYANTLKDGDLLLIDSGTESAHKYASDITRTLPVSGRFDTRQKQIYEVVLEAQLAAIEKASPALTNLELHLIAARTTARGLTELGLMKGDPDEAVQNGAHALFFPHGLGHMLGLDVHDMEDLGDVVGYAEDQQRSSQFGLSFLRLARKLEPGFTLTVEPGVYFVPALIDRWRAAGNHTAFINYDEVEKYRDFGGIRIEDDILITADGCRVLGPPIAKKPIDVEAQMS
jgi:Xaa-Pro aminopeptidase